MANPCASLCARAAAICAALAMAGCVPADPNGDSSALEQVLGLAPTVASNGSTTPSSSGNSSTGDGSDPSTWTGVDPDEPLVTTRHTESEPNDTWDQAEAVDFGGSVELVGTIAASHGGNDCDFYDLGAAHAGQRLQADLANNGADIQLGLLDEQGRLLAYVDPISPSAGPSRVDVILHESTARLYVMVATRSAASVNRGYTATVTLSRTANPLPMRPQAVVLVFQGATQVRIGSRQPIDVPPFDIADVNSEFAGQNEAAIQSLFEKVRDDYDGLNVTFYRDTDPDRPTQGLTVIYFGNSDARLLGLADNVDPFNGDATQSAILYTDTFSLFNQLRPGFGGTMQVLANVTSHEVGHLLGLRHTADPEDILDVTATARQMLADQFFKTANLHVSVLPYGVQDAPAMLGWSVGGELLPRVAPKLYAQAKPAPLAGDEDDFYIPRSLLGDCGCPECDQPHHPAAAAH
ncbi:MAG: hypothetical protein HY718_19160 [Planctomycetes bacterium]|nr:hypothetical protein [Planctomycetota bacterium]